ELIHLPTTTSVNVEFSIHEASLKKVRPGLPARVTVDALPGKVFTGTVAVIAPLPDARSAWMNPDLKVYRSELQLDGNQSGLPAGMSCKVEIIVAEYDEVVYVPVQAVTRVGSQTGVYVMKGDNNPEFRAVEIGLDNNRMAHVKSGLQEGDIVSLTPSLAASAVEPSAPTGRNHAPGEDSSGEKEESQPMSILSMEKTKNLLNPEVKRKVLKTYHRRTGKNPVRPFRTCRLKSGKNSGSN
ncbi:efflux RND transporter periplasmic adaptor subunit, partial [bacterium]|nr:efflux RND transporter periplasmic adaptor subunit [bacterium]